MEYKPTKDAVFSVRANPVLHESGVLTGQLDHVRFTADSGGGTHKEWLVDAASLDRMLHALDSSGMRYEVLNNLRKGARVNLPGVFTATDLGKFGFSA